MADPHTVEIYLNGAPYEVRDAGRRLLAAADSDDQRQHIVDQLDVILRVVAQQRDTIAALRVDIDRQVKAAYATAADCTEHGKEIIYHHHMSYYSDRRADQGEAERVVWVSAAQNIADAVTGRYPELADKIKTFMAKASRAAKASRTRFDTPGPGDCVKAGRCDHPPVDPHAPCDQMRANAPGEMAARIEQLEAELRGARTAAAAG